ncbi:MAG TPA: SIMPL domain-containing protein [Candidatus Omnitrophota bacterium]|nr:SIMPL domain-containing protein [Candidatus Omnitrophota bacterium]HRY85108.1 SIMPL domain-containing protein [Candidatus Omnitrophota bacterium]
MEKENILKNSQIIILGLCIAVATLGSSVILSKGFMKIKKMTTEMIGVTGSAERKILSDEIVWLGGFSRRAADLKTAYGLLKDDLELVKKYLSDQGVKDNEIAVQQAATKILYRKNEKGNDTNDIEAYLVSQNIEVKSKDVEKIAGISRGSTELIDQGVEFISYAPEFFYTRLSELKHELLAEATQDAKRRAERMLAATGNKAGSMRSARSGVFQITPENSTEVSDWGSNDTSALRKKVTAVVRVDFSII